MNYNVGMSRPKTIKRTYINDLLERAIVTIAETFIGMVGAAGIGLLEFDWLTFLSVAGMAALVSTAKSIVARYKGDPDTASLVETN